MSPMPDTNPVQWETRFCDFADNYVRPVLDRLMREEPLLIATAITDINGYLPTHISERSQPQSDDPEWNAAYCRNRRNFIDDITRRAIASEKEAMLATYRMEFGQGRHLAGQERVRADVDQGPPLGQFRARLPRRADALKLNSLSPPGRGLGRGGVSNSPLTFEIFSKRIQYRPRHALRISHHVSIRKSNNPPAASFQVGRTRGVLLLAPDMRLAIQLDAEPKHPRREVDVVGAAFHLAGKFDTIESVGAQYAPQRPFRF